MIKYRGQVVLKENERIDDLERNGYGIIQKNDGFCFGMDAVLLSGFANVRAGGTAVDLGTGTGIIPILLEAKTKGSSFYGIEIQKEMAEMAARSAELNALSDKVHIISGNICRIANADSAADGICAPEDELISRLKGRVDTVTSNPPYMKQNHGLANPGDIKAISRHELKCSLRDVCKAAAVLLKNGGHFYMVHRPLRLPEIISELKAVKLEPKRLKPVYPFADREANMILIDAVKGAGEECRLEKPVIVYKEPGVYSDEIYDIYGY